MKKYDTYNIDDILIRVREAWLKTPELRFGQLIVNIIGSDELCSKIFYIKDIDLRGRLDQWMIKDSETNKTEI